jgi:hypothetical protein
MLYALFRNKKLIGLFDNHKSAVILIQGLISNNLINSNELLLREYHNNSLFFNKEVSLNEPNSETNLYEYNSFLKEVNKLNLNKTNKKVKKKLTEEEKAKLKKIKEDKINIEREKLKLEKKKENLLEKKKEYEYNLKLYNQFKNNIENDKNFEIPELFKEKFELIKNLDEMNELSSQNYYKLYVHKELNNSYSKLFV